MVVKDQESIVEVAPAGPIALLAAVGGLLVVASVLLAADGGASALFALLPAALCGLAVGRLALRRRTPVNIVVGLDTVLLEAPHGRVRRVARARIERCVLLETSEGAFEVHLVQRWRSLRLVVADHRLARDLVARLKRGASETTYWTQSPGPHGTRGAALLVAILQIPYALALLPAALGEPSGAAASMFASLSVTEARVAQFLFVLGPWAAFAFLMFVLLRVLLPERRITVRHDGLTVGWWGGQRFVPFEHLEEISQLHTGVQLVLRDDARPIDLPMPPTDARSLADLLREATKPRTRASPPLWLADRGERSLRDWVATIRRPAAAGLRDPAPSKDDLFRVVEDGDARPIDRASAAIALGRSLSDDDRRRLAEITEGVATPKLRVVLEHTMDEDDDALATMLEQLEVRS